jgi:predicted Zn-dependent protease
MDREEVKLRRGAFTIKEAPLVGYVQSVLCRLAGEHCPDVRTYIVRSPMFNASMAPNGMMQVWTGLLLRVENEAQLAAVLGHELGHYLERHTLQRMQDLKGKAAFGTFLAAFGLAGAIANVGLLATVPAFSREQESRADRFGLTLMKKTGYDATEAARIWDNLLGELKVRGGEDVGRWSPLFATHPAVEGRRDDLLRFGGEPGGDTGAERLRSAVAPHRMEWLRDEVRRGQYEESLALFARLLVNRPDDAQVLAARGEVYRLREGEGDFEHALADLRRAVDLPQPPADAFRSLGLVLRRRSDTGGARAAFERYLALAPDSADSTLIKTYLDTNP